VLNSLQEQQPEIAVEDTPQPPQAALAEGAEAEEGAATGENQEPKKATPTHKTQGTKQSAPASAVPATGTPAAAPADSTSLDFLEPLDVLPSLTVNGEAAQPGAQGSDGKVTLSLDPETVTRVSPEALRPPLFAAAVVV
jgi:hypothetical protein